ncbi:maleylacetoacetate isomerase [Sedimenticola thiotaurini]|uniref:Maleylacetoacetate isomerase n=1 Tax=Sedimenticola thiotaurini TaxID=1543721 RepID=A0A0F7JSN6_9GAMM|nr:maleylacetoacetate isomerase [Sedimenticola thiotaurini]AKH19461.1 maleylacetoacetate isomerase [Sedimenticola thiotaurini]
MMKLYDYYRSTAAYRVRIALNLKGLDYQQIPVNLLTGEDGGAEYRTVNPQGLVPALALDDGVLQQSLAICEYLDETVPEPPLLPGDARQRSRVRALAQMVVSDIHPVNNLRILQYLTRELGVSEEQKQTWYHHWIHEGFRPMEQLLAAQAAKGKFCFGDQVTLADICLVPQVYNARRFALDLTPYPRIVQIEQACLQLEAFNRARPEHQPEMV